MTKPLIIADGVLPEARAFHDAREALVDWPEIVLFSHVANFVGEEVPADAVIYNLEPLYEGCQSFSLGYRDLLRRHPVLDYQARNVEYLRSLGIEAVHMPYGYHPSMWRPAHAVKDIDVLFFGSLLSDRRKRILDELAVAGVKVTAATDCYGADLDKMVARSKIVLNIHRMDHLPLEVVRLNYLLANGAFVISERGWDESDNVTYSPGLVYAAPDDVVPACRYFLKNTDICDGIAAKGQHIIRNMPQSRFIKQARAALGVYA